MIRRHKYKLLGLLALLVLAAFLGLHWLLSSGLARDRLVAELQSAYGGQVEIDSVEVGLLGGSTARNVRLYPADDKQERPWFTVKEIKADVSVLDILAGRSIPRIVTLIEPVVRVHVDPAGKLRTRLPDQPEGNLPEDLDTRVDVVNGSIRLLQDGKPDSRIDGISATVQAGEVFTFAGKAERLELALIDLEASEFEAKAELSKDGVKLTSASARTLGGKLSATGAASIVEPLRVDLEVTAEGLDFARIPPSWPMPEQLRKLTGKLAGKAKLGASYADGELITAGNGAGLVTEAKLADLPVDPIHLRLASSKTGFRFEQEKEGTAPPPVKPEPAPPVKKDAPVKKDLPAQETYFNVNFGMRDIDIGELVRRLELDLPFTIAGTVSFRVKAALPVSSPRNIKAYKLDGTADFPNLVLAGIHMAGVHAALEYDDGVLALDKLTGRLASAGGVDAGGFEGNARLEYLPSGKLTARMNVAEVSVGQALVLIPEFAEQARGKFSGQITLQAPVNDLDRVDAWQAEGEVTTKAARLYNINLSEGVLAVRLAKSELSIVKLGGKIDQAPVSGSGKLGLKAPYAFQSELSLGEANLALLQRVPKEVRPAFSFSGRLAATVKAAGQLEPFKIEQFEGTASGRRLSAAGFTVEVLQFAWQLREQQLELANLLAVIGGGRLGGAVVVPFQPDKPGRLDLRFQNLPGSGELRGAILFNDREFTLRDLDGTIADGTLRGQLGYALHDPRRRWFRLELQNAESAKLLAWWPEFEGVLAGGVNARLAGVLGSEWRGGADITLPRAKVFGCAVTDMRLPGRFTFAPLQLRGQLDVADASAQAANGRVTGRGSLRFGMSSRLDGKINFHDVDLRSLLQPITTSSVVAAGRITGLVTLKANALRSLDDLQATFEGKLRNTQAFQLPVLQPITGFVPIQPSTMFESGQVRGTLGNGVFRIQRLSLEGPAAQVYLSGTVTMAGRLGLKAMIMAGPLALASPVLRVVGIRLPTTGPLPLALLLRVTEYFANRIIYLDVRGAISRPIIRIRPLPALSEEAARYFLRR